MKLNRSFHGLLVLFLTLSLGIPVFGAARKKKPAKTLQAAATKSGGSVKKGRFAKSSSSLRQAKGKKRGRSYSARRPRTGAFVRASLRSTSSRYSRRSRSNYVSGGPWTEPTFADSTVGDNVEGEDLIVRRAAVEALGPFNGTVVVADPQTGRLLTIVNQKLAFKSGFQPCSTIKVVAALAGLNEGLIDRDTHMRLYGRTTMNLTDALARSNNMYFANIGIKLGYDKIAHYARMFGLGEKAGYNIAEEQVGTIPSGPPANGGMGMMTSFGEGIKLNPLQLTAVLSAVANGGTLYWLQHPRTQDEADRIVPQVKRRLEIQNAIPELKPGLLGATEYGTARRAASDQTEPIFGKTGTCTDRATPTHLGWFGSFNEVGGRKLVVVVLLTGGRPINGPVASGVAGSIYRNLALQRYSIKSNPTSPLAKFQTPTLSFSGSF
jgi:penicillin-binding protein 2